MIGSLVRTLFTSRGAVAAAGQVLLVNIIILAINLVTGVITARLLGPAGRGEQAALILWPQFLASVFTIGLPSALLYNLKRNPDRASQLFSSALLLGTVMGILSTLVGVLFVPRWLNEYSSEVAHFAQWLMLTTPLFLLNLMFAAVFQVREEFALYNAVRYLPPLLTLIALALLALVYDLTPFSAALSYVLPIVPVSLWMLQRLWRFYQPRWQDLTLAFRRLASYGLRSYGVDLLGTLARQLDQVLVVGLLAPTMMGLYVVALSAARLLEVFQSAVGAVLFPKATGRTVEEVVALTGRAVRVNTAVTLLVAVAFALFGPWALGLVYGKEFLAAGGVFRLLLLDAVFGACAWVMAHAFLAVGRPEIVTVLQGIGVGLAVVLVLVLVPRYGLEGVGVALVISSAVRLIFVILSFPLILKMRPPRLWLNREEVREFVQSLANGGRS